MLRKAVIPANTPQGTRTLWGTGAGAGFFSCASNIQGFLDAATRKRVPRSDMTSYFIAGVIVIVLS